MSIKGRWRSAAIAVAWLASTAPIMATALLAGSGAGATPGEAMAATPSPADEAGTSDWSMYRGNAARTGAVASTGPTADPAVLWTTPFDTMVGPILPPVVAGDTLYVLVPGVVGELWALDRTTGDERWRAPVGTFGDSSGIAPPLAATGEMVFVVGSFGTSSGDNAPPTALYAFDAATGREAWRVVQGVDVIATAPVVVAGILHLATFEAEGTVVYAIEAATGASRWRVVVGADLVPAAPLSVGANTVYAALLRPQTGGDQPGGEVLALDGATGAERWRVATEYALITPPVVATDSLYVVSIVSTAGSDLSRFTLSALDVISGSVRWQTPLPAAYASVPTVAGDLVYVGSAPFGRSPDGPPGLYALDAATGVERWRVEGLGDPAIAGGVLYANTFGATGAPHQPSGLVALDAATGAELWRLDDVGGAPVVADGVIYIASFTGVVAIGGATNPPVSIGPAARPGDPPLEPPSGTPEPGAEATVVITWLERGKPIGLACFAVYPDPDPLGKPAPPPGAEPIVVACDVDDDPPGVQGDGHTVLHLAPGDFVIVQTGEPGTVDCRRYVGHLSIEPFDAGRKINVEVRGMC